jgi:hypothetical protein
VRLRIDATYKVSEHVSLGHWEGFVACGEMKSIMLQRQKDWAREHAQCAVHPTNRPTSRIDLSR